MTSLAVPRLAHGVPRPSRDSVRVLSAVMAGLAVTAVAGGLVVLEPDSSLGLIALFGGLLMVGGVVVLYRHPEVAPWGAILLFATSSELKLRVSPMVGVVKDGYVILLVGIAVVHVLRHRSAVRRLRPMALPLAALGLLVGMYLLDPAGGHGTSWMAATRLLLEVLALLVVGMLLAPQKALAHLMAAMTVALPFEAAFAWLQQAAGVNALVYGWGYQWGAQVRFTSSGGLRTSGTFEDPFQLAALAVLGLALALFAARRWQAAVLIGSALAILAATSVRTSLIQAGVLLVLYAIRRGWWRPAAALAAVAAVAGVLFLATTTTEVTPGAPPVPLLFSLNGRSTSWGLAVDGPLSFIAGNGVGARGTGSTVTTAAVSAAPGYDPNALPPAVFAGNPAFLDSSYAQVQSDVGIVGTAALLTALGGLIVFVVRCCRSSADGAPWAAGAVLAVSMIDWVGRSSLASYTTGFLTLYVLGVLLGAGQIRRDGP